jgi:hypothetical protein
MDTNMNVSLEGHIKIIDLDSGEVIVNKRNAVNKETASFMLAYTLSGVSEHATQRSYQISELVLGNGGTVVDATGNVIFKGTNTTSVASQLHNETYSKYVSHNVDEDSANNIAVVHTPGVPHSDIVITATLDYHEPISQDETDTADSISGTYVFNELGLRSQTGKLMTHVVFHPVQKSANRKLQIVYTVRIKVG